MVFLDNLRKKYKETPTLREIVKLIPFAGGPIDALVAPDDAMRFFTPIDKSFLKKQSRRKVESILNTSIGDWPLIVQNLDLKRKNNRGQTTVFFTILEIKGTDLF